jgi:N-methylhydantoinase B/oxoprolinase/acetone carboxylase alpha subunit
MLDVPVRAGDRILHVQPSAGGYGDPWQRDPYRVLEDVLDEKITVAYAEREYGVVINPHTLQLDEKQTAARRQARDGYDNGESVEASVETAITASAQQQVSK